MSGSRRAKSSVKSDAVPPRLRLAVQVALDAAGADGLPVRSTLRRWLSRALRRDAAVTVRFVGAAEGRRLNRTFRGKDYATNVLTFAYHGAPGAAPLTGDIALCVPVLRREARAARKTLRAHCAHLVIHGILHLQGFDHGSAKDARVMEALETRLLAGLGYDDPYAPS